MEIPGVQGRSRILLGGAILFGLLSVASLAVDLPVAAYVSASDSRALPRDLHKFVALSEAFAHALGVGTILVAVGVLDRRRMWSVVRIAGCAFGAGLLANVAKLLVARIRPAHFASPGNTVWDSFVGFLPIVYGTSTDQPFNSVVQSFPSAHTATAVGLAIGLTARYPHGRWLFAALAVFATLQRIDASDHYLSDCFAGAALACVVGMACLGNGPLGRYFDRLEGE